MARPVLTGALEIIRREKIHSNMAMHNAVGQRGRTTEHMIGIKAGGCDFAAMKIGTQGVAEALRELLLARQQAASQLPARKEVSRQHQKRHAASVNRIRAGFVVRHDEIHRLHKTQARASKHLGHGYGFGRFAGQERAFGGGDAHGLLARKSALVAHGLAAYQIVGLHGGGAVINAQDFGVAVVLGSTRFFDEARPAMHLHPRSATSWATSVT